MYSSDLREVRLLRGTLDQLTLDRDNINTSLYLSIWGSPKIEREIIDRQLESWTDKSIQIDRWKDR